MIDDGDFDHGFVWGASCGVACVGLVWLFVELFRYAW